jgi:hypothetical protein
MDDSTQAHCLAKVFNSPKIKYLNKVLILVNKSGVLHPLGSKNKPKPSLCVAQQVLDASVVIRLKRIYNY